MGGDSIVARGRTSAAVERGEGGGGGGKGTQPLFVRGTSGTTTRDECDDGYRDDGNNTSDRDEKETERIEEVRRKLVERWHAYSDPDAPIEHRRFQIRTSTRGGGGGGGLTAQSLSNADPAVDIAPLLSSVLFGNEKARQIVRAAHDVLSKFGGVVPETANITNPPRLMYALSPNPLDGRMRILASP